MAPPPLVVVGLPVPPVVAAVVGGLVGSVPVRVEPEVRRTLIMYLAISCVAGKIPNMDLSNVS